MNWEDIGKIVLALIGCGIVAFFYLKFETAVKNRKTKKATEA